MFFLSFGEFGCETILPTFLIPRINNNFPEYRKIVIGWNNREYFYRDLCDEYWELDSKYMQLKNNSYAFENISVEIASLHKRLAPLGVVLDGTKIGKLCVKAKCKKCFFEFEVDRGDVYCAKCYSEKIEKSLFQGAREYRKYANSLSPINSKYIDFASAYIPKNTVALFARNRKTYNRNLTIDHYNKIIDMIIGLGYKVVLLGEFVSSHFIQNNKVINFMNHDLAGNLEAAFAIVDQCVFSLQFFTASSRIGSLLNKPYIIFESADQIYGRGQEGIRLSLLTKNYDKKKIVLSNYLDIAQNTEEAIQVAKQAIHELIIEKNSNDLFFRPNSYAQSLQESGMKRLW